MWLVGNIQNTLTLSSVISTAVRNIDITSNGSVGVRQEVNWRVPVTNIFLMRSSPLENSTDMRA
ncbi:hypothetical protein INR49_012770 [Caranx melampygus]|nr:hypothetical protein INR49_012770 [Caranx melampygus]